MAQYLLNATDAEMAEWRQAADAKGISFAEWLRRAAGAALRKQKPRKP